MMREPCRTSAHSEYTVLSPESLANADLFFKIL